VCVVELTYGGNVVLVNGYMEVLCLLVNGHMEVLFVLVNGHLEVLCVLVNRDMEVIYVGEWIYGGTVSVVEWT